MIFPSTLPGPYLNAIGGGGGGNGGDGGGGGNGVGGVGGVGGDGGDWFGVQHQQVPQPG